MVVQQISERQVADLVTSLARGRSIAQTATRLRIPSEAVDFIGRQNGYPDTTELNRNSRILNKRLRDVPPDEDVDTDVPISESDPAAAPSEVEEPEVDEPDVVLWRCVRRGCGYALSGPKSAAEDDVQHAIQLHKQTHSDQDTTVVIPGPVHVGHPANERRPHDCAACRDEAVEPPVIVPGEVVDEYSSVAAAIDELVAEGLVEVVEPEASGDRPSTLGSYECPVAGCSYVLAWAGPAGDLESDDYIEQQIARHEEWHRSGVEVAHVPNGHSVPTQIGALLGDMVHVLAEAVSTDSPGPLPSGEVVPDAADVATSEQHGVRDARDTFEHAYTEGGWLAGGPRTIERLLDEAARTGHEPIMELAARIRGDLQLLADRLDRWVDLADQRRAILHELEILGRRQDELTEKLTRLDADTDQPAPVVASQTPTEFGEAVDDLRAAVDGERLSLLLPSNEVWGALPVEVRKRIRPWAEEHQLPLSRRGQMPRVTVLKYLAAHPEDDHR